MEMGNVVGQLSLFDEREDIARKAQEYFDENPRLLAAFEDAADVMQRLNGKVSARFLVEFARGLRFIGYDGMGRLLDCFSGIVVMGEDVAAIPNAYSAWLTRHLEQRGNKVTKARSRLDE